MQCNSTSPIGSWHNTLTITPHVNHNAMLVGTWACQRLSALRVCLWMHLHATLPPPPFRPAYNFHDLPYELVGIPKIYEGDDATSVVQAPPLALTLSNDPFVPSVWFYQGGGGGQMSFQWMLNRPACPPFFWGGGNI